MPSPATFLKNLYTRPSTGPSFTTPGYGASSHILETFAYQCLLQHHSQQCSCLAKEEGEANLSRGLRGPVVGEGGGKGTQRMKGAIDSTYKIDMSLKN